MKRLLTLFAALVLLGGVDDATAGAVDTTWDGGAGSGAWTSANNWNPNGVPTFDNQANLFFAGTTQLLSTNNSAGAITVRTITFNTGAGAFTLSGTNVTLANAAGIVNNSTNTQTISFTNLGLGQASMSFDATSGELVINSILTGVNGFDVTGTRVTLTGTSTHTGANTVTSGALRIANSSALGTTAAGTTVSSGAALELTTNNAGGNISIGAEALSLAGTGINSAGALRNITGSNSYGGLLTLTNATRINSDAGTLTLTNTGTITGATFGLTFGGAGNLTVNSIIGTTTGTLTKDGAGTLILGAANTYTGDTTVGAGVLRLSGSGSIDAASGVVVSNGATFDLNSISDTVDGVSGAGAVTLGSATLTVSNSATNNLSGVLSGSGGLIKVGAGTQILSGTTNSYGGTTTIGAGVLNVGALANAGANSSIGTNGTIIITNGGVLQYGGSTVSIDRNINLASGSGVIGVTNSATSLTIAGVISNTGSLVKTNAGELILSGANNYSGTTLITNGVLNIQNNAGLGATNSGTTVGSGAALELEGGITVGAETLALSGTGISAGGALRNISGNNTYGGTITNVAASRINSDAGTLTLSEAINANALALTFGGAGNIAANGAITNSTAGLTKDGAGTATLSGNNTYSGTTTLSAGTLRATTSAGAMGSGALSLGGGTLELANDTGLNFARNTTVTGSTTISSERLTSGAGVTHTLGTLSIGAFTLTAGTDATVTSGTAGLTFGAATLTGAATFSVNSGTQLTFSSTMGGDFAKTFTGAGNTTVSGILSGLGGVNKSGAGTLTLAAANTFTGNLAISNGAVRGISNAAAFGAPTSVILAGGNLEMANDTALNFAEALVVSNNATITSDRLTAGAGVTHTNNTLSIGAQTLSIAAGSNVTSGAGGVQFSGTTTLRASGAVFSVDSDAQLTLGTVSGNTFGFTVGGAGNTTIGGVIGTTTGTLSKTDAGTLTLGNAANTYGGVTTIGGGVLVAGTLANAGTSSSIGTNATVVITNGGKLHYTGASTSINRGINLAAGNGEIGVSSNAAALTISGAISNTGTLVKSGAGTLILTASNNYQGGTLLNAGTLAAGNAFAFGSGSVTIGSGTTLNLSNLSIANVLINNGGTLTNLGTVSGAELNAGTTTLSSSNSTVAEVSGTALVNVTGANTVITNVTGGTVNVSGANAAITTVGGGSVNANANANVQSLVGGNVSVTNGASIIVESGNSAGTVSGGGNLVKIGAGTLALSGNNTFTGTTVISNGVVSISTNAALAGTTQVNMNNGAALAYTGGSATLDRNIAVTNGTGTIRNTGGGTLALSGNLSKSGTVLTFSGGAFNITGVISGASANSDLIVDNATVTLNNTNTYNGPTIIRNAGTLVANVVGAMPTNTRSAVTMDDTGTGNSVLNINANQQIASLAGAASSSASIATNTSLTIGAASGNTTFAGVISGGGGLVKDGASTQTLTGANTYSGGTLVSAGALAGNTTSLQGNITNNATVVFAQSTNGTYAGVLSGGGALVKTNTATLTLTGANTQSGGTLVAAGTLQIGNGGTTGSLAGAITNNGTLAYNRADNLTQSTIISGSGNLTKSGAGTLTLSSSNSYSGANTISAGTVRAENAYALGALNAGDAITLAGGNLQLAADSATTFGANTGYGTTIEANTTITSDRLTVGAGVAQQLGLLTMGAQTLTVEKGVNVTSGTATLAIGGATTLSGNATFATAAGTELRFDETISGAVNITKTGDGILTLNRGGGQVDTTITAGQLNINHFQALGTPAGTLTLGSGVTLDNTSGSSVTVGNAKSISLGSTLNFLGSNDLNLGSGTTTLTNNTAINVSAGTLTLGGDVVGGAFGLTKNGAGTLQLSGLTGTNSFTGNSFINAGELFLNGTSVFGGTTNTLVTIETNAFLRVGSSASVGNVTLVLNNPDGLILSSVITNDVVFSNSGTISSTYANVDGSITIGEGVTMTTAANYLGTIPATNTPGRIVLDNNATLAATATFTINQNQGITLQPGTATFSPGTNVQVFIASSIAGDGELRKTGAGNVRLTGSNSYTGGTVIDQGIIGITSDSSLGAVTGRVKLNNGTLVAAQNNTGGPTNSGTTVNASRTLVLGNGTTNNIDAQSGLFFEYNGVIGEENGAGAASSMRFGIGGTREGTVKLGALNTYDGSTTIVAGTLEISNIADGGQASGIGQSGNAASNLVIGGTLRYAGTSGTTDRLFSIGSTGVATLDSGSGALAFTNTGAMGYGATNLTRHDINLTGSGTGTLALALGNDVHDDPLHVAKSGNGTWILSGSNDYTGATTIAGGTLQVSSDANLGRTSGSGGLIFTNGGTLKTTGSFTNARLVDMKGAGTVNTEGSSLAFSGVVGGNGALTKAGAGTLSLTAANNYSGGTLLNAGTLRLANASAAGSGTITQSDGSSTLVIDTTGTVANAMSIFNIATLQSVTLSGAKTLNNATYNITNNTTTTETGVLSGGGGVTKDGAGTLVLAGSANNTYTGATVVNAGALVLSNSLGNAINASSGITVNSGTSLILGASNQIGDGIGLTLNGGTFIVGTSTAGYSETLGTLTLSASSTIDLGSYSTGLRQLTFANSSAITWTGTLTVTNWQGLNLQSSDVAEILFGTGGLTTTQLGQIYFANQDVNGGTLVGANGELVPIPEAEVYWGALAVALAVGYRERRRLFAILRQVRR